MHIVPQLGGQGEVPHRIGQFVVLGRISYGGMGEILLAERRGDAGFRKLVVIKRSLAHLAEDPEVAHLFLNEARIAARFSHSNVCQVYDLGTFDGRYYIAMEYLEGVPFSELFRVQGLLGTFWDYHLIAGIAHQASEGLHHVHELRARNGTPLEIVHRDISPANVFVTTDGVVKLLDFGVAKVTSAADSDERSSVKGKYAYMSPEQLRGGPLDRRSDVFSLAIVVFEAITGRRLFPRATDVLAAKAILDGDIPAIRSLRADVPEQLCSVIERALRKPREERFATAREFGAELVRAAGGELGPAAIAQVIGPHIHDIVERRRQVIAEAERTALSGAGASGPEPESASIEIASPAVEGSVVHRAVAATVTEKVRRTLPPLAPRPSLLSLSRRASIPTLVVLLCVFALLGFELWSRLRAPAPAVPNATAPQPERAGVVDAGELPRGERQVVLPDAAPPAAVAAGAAPEPPRQKKKNRRVRNDARRVPRPRDAAVRDEDEVAGLLSIDSRPYATIFVDGGRAGDTPVVELSLAPGVHRVRAVLPDGRSQSLTITIVSGQLHTRRLHW